MEEKGRTFMYAHTRHIWHSISIGIGDVSISFRRRWWSIRDLFFIWFFCFVFVWLHINRFKSDAEHQYWVDTTAVWMGPNSHCYDKIKKNGNKSLCNTKNEKCHHHDECVGVCVCWRKVVFKCLLFYLIHADIIYFGCTSHSRPCIYLCMYMCDAYIFKIFCIKV